MPELPEVEVVVREMRPRVVGRRIQRAHILWERIVQSPPASIFTDAIANQVIADVSRRGKYILFRLRSDDTLILHLRMTGGLHFCPPQAPRLPHTHAVLELDNETEIHYRDARKFGRFYLVSDPSQVVGKLGPEPLGDDFTVEYLTGALAGRKAAIKTLLLNQHIVAGVGNIYADESLFHAGIHPLRPGGTLTVKEVKCLYQALRTDLAMAIEDGGSTLNTYLPPSGAAGRYQERHQVFRRANEPCPRCGNCLSRIVVAQRSTHFCSQCQR